MAFKAFKKPFEAPQGFLIFSRGIERDLIGSSKLPGPKAKNGKTCFQVVWKEIICMKWVKW